MAKSQTSLKEYLIMGITAALAVGLGGYLTGSYLLLGVVSSIIPLSIWMGRWFERRTPPDKFHFFQLWKIPDPTTRGAIWLIAAFDGALHSLRVFAIFALVSMASSRSLDMSGSLAAIFAVAVMALATPASYWRYRRRYEPIAETGGALLRYAGESPLTFREKCGAALAITVGGAIAWWGGLLTYMTWFI